MEQYAAVVQLMPEVERVLKGKGESVPRPDYEGRGTVGEEEEGGGEGDREEREGEERKKGNFEETSEEDG